MLRFSDYEQLDEASKNLHLTHIEETIITEGSEGANNALGFLKGANRFEIGYGKKREGIFCVGGVCKTVPSSNGFSLNISSSF